MLVAVAPEALAETQSQANEQLRNQLIAAVTALYGAGIAADMVADPVALVQFLARLVPLSLAAQAQMVRSTTINLHRQLPLDKPIAIKPTDLIGAKLRGKPIEQVYARAVYDVEERLDAGDTFEEAVNFGLHRVTQNAVTDLQLASTHAAAAYTEQLQERVRVKVGLKRQLSNRPDHCALCILATTQLYHAGKLMPIHPGCGCEPVVVFEDEIEQFNSEMDQRYLDIHDIVRRDLGDKYQRSDARSGLQPYRNIIVTHEHGELGPVLGVRAQHFEGPVQRVDPHRTPPPREESGVPLPVPVDI